jgi:hypothetical protein
MFVTGKPFKHSLMFVGKAKSLPKSAAPEVLCSSGLCPYPQALDKVGKA